MFVGHDQLIEGSIEVIYHIITINKRIIILPVLILQHQFRFFHLNIGWHRFVIDRNLGQSYSGPKMMQR